MFVQEQEGIEMGFEGGSLSYRAFYLSGKLPEDMVKRFAKHAIPPIDTLTDGEINGWVSGRHMLDRKITDENAFLAGYFRLTLVKAEKKIPEALLRAECKIEELARMSAEGKDFLKRGERIEIKKAVIDRLLPTMPPTLTGIPVLFDTSSEVLYAGATTESQMDVLVIKFQEAAGVKLIPLTPQTASLKRRHISVEGVEPTSFSPELEDPLAGGNIGQDFLTWLWFYSEMRGGLMTIEKDQYGVMLEGPLTFYLEGDGAHLTLLRNGAPLVSSEAKTAMLSGKKLVSAKITMSHQQEMWSVMLDANNFIFRGMKIPRAEEEIDAVSRFQQRMVSLDRFMNAFLSYYDRFLDERLDRKQWKPVQKDIHKWVSDRVAKK